MSPRPTPSKRSVLVVSHTHWDREWYHAHTRFRQGLLALVDAVLATPGEPFLLDGQAIVLRDYLDVRPEGAAELANALREGWLEAGPWYVLADNLIPSGEAIVRNLDAGRRLLRRLGASAPAVAYCPDSFGHPAALPWIAAQFGCRVAIVWRGAGGRAHPPYDSFWWMAPDGTRLLTHHLPPDGYEFGSALPVEPTAAQARWRHLNAHWNTRAATDVCLLLNGADHHARQPDIRQAVHALQAAAGSTGSVHRATLGDWARAFEQASAAARTPLATVAGELRDSYGYTWTLGSTLATRAYQKRRNARLERALLRDVEPWLALWRLQQPQPAGLSAGRTDAVLTEPQLTRLLHRAWEELLETHPHDTLCGCSIDAVARATDHRQEQVASQREGLTRAALHGVLGHNPVLARDHNDFAWQRIVVRNRTARPRAGLALLRLIETLGDVPVGPASAGSAPVVPSTEAGPLQLGSWLTQELDQQITDRRRESPQHYPDNDRVRVRRVLAWLPEVPAFGLRRWDALSIGQTPVEPPRAVTLHERHDAITIENGRLRVVIDQRRGRSTVALTASGRTIRDVCWLETQADLGDSYTPSLRGPVERLRVTRAWIVHNGPLRAGVALEWHASSRARRRGGLRVITHLFVDAESPALRCVVSGVNKRTDHRLQLVWRSDVHGGQLVADAAFGPVDRSGLAPSATAAETPPPGMPMHRWMLQTSARRSAMLVSDGLAEVEPQEGRLALTLLRGVGALSRPDLPERPGHAGWPEPIPAAQCLGPFRATVAFALDGPYSSSLLGRVRDLTDDLLLPLVGESWRDFTNQTAPAEIAGPTLHGDALEASACTVSADDAAAIILRAVNLTGEPAHGTWTMPDDGPWLVTPVRLDETPIGPPTPVTRSIPVAVGPRGVSSVRVERAALPR